MTCENKFGSQRVQDTKLRTQNLKTQDVKPKTQDPGPETRLLNGPKLSSYKLSCLGLTAKPIVTQFLFSHTFRLQSNLFSLFLN